MGPDDEGHQHSDHKVPALGGCRGLVSVRCVDSTACDSILGEFGTVRGVSINIQCQSHLWILKRKAKKYLFLQLALALRHPIIRHLPGFPEITAHTVDNSPIQRWFGPQLRSNH